MKTKHKIIYDDTINLVKHIPKDSVDLIVTSPPYPMIEMWDNVWPNSISKIIKTAPNNAFRLIHSYLANIWMAAFTVLKPGGILCINIGDAVRSLNGKFQLYPNSSFIHKHLFEFFNPLPSIIWRKVANSPTSFMGSGTLPVNAYVTLEHEYILIFRKGKNREFKGEEKERRNNSCLFWEERNTYFSDLWTDSGTNQGTLAKLNRKSAAYPFTIPYKLILMYSIQGDTVLDPFLGTGTTMLASMATGRSCIGIEKNKELKIDILTKLLTLKEVFKTTIHSRKLWHDKFVKEYKKEFKYEHRVYGPVKTKHEMNIRWPVYVGRKVLKKNNYICCYKDTKNE